MQKSVPEWKNIVPKSALFRQKIVVPLIFRNLLLEGFRHWDGVVVHCVEEDHDRVAFAFHLLCPFVDGSLEESEALCAKVSYGRLQDNLVRIEYWCEEIRIDVCHDNAETVKDMLPEYIDEVPCFAHVKQ